MAPMLIAHACRGHFRRMPGAPDWRCQRLAAARVSVMKVLMRSKQVRRGGAYTIAMGEFPLDLGCLGGLAAFCGCNPWNRMVAAEAGFTIDRPSLPAWALRASTSVVAPRIRTHLLWPTPLPRTLEAIGPNDVDCSAAELPNTICRFNPDPQRESAVMSTVSNSILSRSLQDRQLLCR